MHRSRLAGFIIDCQTTDLGAAANFWSKVPGLPRRAPKDPEDVGYIGLEIDPRDLHIEVQQVDHPSRVHLDIEADDVEAEVRDSDDTPLMHRRKFTQLADSGF